MKEGRGVTFVTEAGVWTQSCEAFERVVATTRAVLGEPTYAAEWAAGSALAQDTAVAEALLDEVYTRKRRV
jgi:hypothetical protein